MTTPNSDDSLYKDAQSRNDTVGTDDSLRKAAIGRLRKKRDLSAHVIAYVTVNATLIAIWFVTSGGDGLFWPMFPLLGWGIGLVFHTWDVFSPEVPSEDKIQREMKRLSTK